MKIQVIQTLPNGQVTQQVLSKEGAEVLKIQAQPGAKISFNVEGAKPAEAANAKAKTGNIKKVGNNLVLESEGEALVEVTDFYSTAGASVGDVSWNYAAADAGVTAATPEAQALSSDAAVSESGALFPAIAPGWLVAGGAATVAAVASGGGSSVASVGTTVISGTVMLGPVKAGSNLQVTLYKADGTVLTTANVQDNGTFSASYVASYTGVVMARLTDNNGNSTADYRDEASNSDKDLTTDIRALFSTAGAGTTNITLSALSEMAVRQILGDSGGDAGSSNSVAGTKTAAEITTKNAALAVSLGLTGNVVTDFVINPTVNADGSPATANAAGLIVAALSGLDAIYGTDGALDMLTATGITAAAVVDLVVLGAQEAGVLSEFSNVSAVGAAATAASNTATATITSSLNSTTIAALSPLVLSQINPTQIGLIPDTAMAGLTVAQLAALTTDQIAQITPTQIIYLSAAQITALGLDVVSLSIAAVDSMTVVQSLGLTSAQLGALVNTTAPTTGASLTNDSTPTISGTFSGRMPLGASIQILDEGVAVGTATVNGTNWTWTPTTSIGADGVHNFTAEMMIGLVTASVPATATTSTSLSLTLDTVAPTFAAVTMTAAENGTAVTGTLGATDTSGVTYTLGSGLDTALFSLSGSTLTLLAAKNYEVDETTDHAYTLNVVATDAVGNATTSVVTVNLTNVNEAPTAVGTIAAQTAVVGIAYTFGTAASFADADAGGLTGGVYTATGLGNGLTIDPSTGVISGIALANADAAPVVVTFTDSGTLAVSQAAFNLTAVSAPVVQSIAVSDATGVATKGKSGEALSFVVTLSEAVTTTGTLTAHFSVNGVDVTATSAAVTGAATITFTTGVVPATGNGTAISLTSLVATTGAITGDVSHQPMVAPTAAAIAYAGYTVDNTAPTFAAVTMTAAENSTVVTGTLGATDTSGVTYSLGSGLDTALFNLSGSTLTFIGAKNYEVDETTDHAYTLNVIATDAVGNATTSVVTVNLTNVNEAPTVATPLVDQSAVLSQAFNYVVPTGAFTDVDAATTITYSATLVGGAALSTATGWTGLAFNASTRTFTGTATNATTGDIDVRVTASDGSLSIYDDFHINAVSAPALSTTLTSAVTNFDVRSSIVFSVGETVTANAGGTITLTDLGGTGFRGEAATHTQTIDINNTSLVQIVGTGANTKIIINPTNDLDLSSNYSLAVSDGAFHGSTYGQDSVHFTTVNFSTVAPGVGIAGAVQAQSMNTSTGVLANSLKWFDASDIGTPGPSAYSVINLSSADYAATFKETNLAISELDGQGKISFTNFGANDLIYIDSQDPVLTNVQSTWAGAIFGSGVGTVASPLAMYVGGNGQLGAYDMVIAIDSAVVLPNLATDQTLANVISNGWSTTGMVIAA